MLPDQAPGSAVSTCPSWAVPEIVGGLRFVGRFPATTAVAPDDACVDPPAFDAVTTTRRVKLTSAEVAVYVEAVAPEMFAHEPPDGSQRRHWYA